MGRKEREKGSEKSYRASEKQTKGKTFFGK